jgi:hypothetical protein
VIVPNRVDFGAFAISAQYVEKFQGFRGFKISK